MITELQLCVKQPEKALGLLTYLQNQILNGSNEIKMLKTKDKEPKEKKVFALNLHYCFINILNKYGFRWYNP